MFNSDRHLSADLIREWMGIFDSIKTVAKYAGIVIVDGIWSILARLGQCFSTTRPIVDVDVIEIPDIEYNSYCFSDGVRLNTYIAETLGRKNIRDVGGTRHQRHRVWSSKPFLEWILTSSLLMFQVHFNFVLEGIKGFWPSIQKQKEEQVTALTRGWRLVTDK